MLKQRCQIPPLQQHIPHRNCASTAAAPRGQQGDSAGTAGTAQHQAALPLAGRYLCAPAQQLQRAQALRHSLSRLSKSERKAAGYSDLCQENAPSARPTCPRAGRQQRFVCLLPADPNSFGPRGQHLTQQLQPARQSDASPALLPEQNADRDTAPAGSACRDRPSHSRRAEAGAGEIGRAHV